MRHILRRLRRPRSLTAAAIASTICVAAIGSATVLGQGDRPSPRAGVAGLHENSGCRDADPSGQLYSARVISPTEILSCESATMQISLGTSCDSAALDVVLSIDRSGSMMRSGALKEAVDGANDLLQSLNMRDNPNTRVAVVSHGEDPRVEIGLSNSEGAVRGKIIGLRGNPSPNDNIGKSILKSLEELNNEEDGIENRRRVIVVFSDGETDGDPSKKQAARSAAGRVRSSNNDVALYSVCVNLGDSDCNLMADLASERRYAYKAESTRSVAGKFLNVARELRDYRIANLKYAEILPVGLDIVSGTESPDFAPSSDFDERRLEWVFGGDRGGDPTDIVTRTIKFTMRPDVVDAELPITFTLSRLEATFTDSLDKSGSISVPLGTLRVTGACPDQAPPPAPPATPTDRAPQPPLPAPPTPTPTVEPPSPAEPPPPPLVQPWPSTRATYRIALPIAQLNHCMRRVIPPDTVLLVDVSTSMSGVLDDQVGRSKLDEARLAALQYVKDMKKGDRAAIVTFGNDTQLSPAGLTENRALLLADLNNEALWEHRPGTRIDRALRKAIHVLKAAAWTDQTRRPIIVLITDGRLHDGNHVRTARNLASEFFTSRLDGYSLRGRLFTVAVGPGCSEQVNPDAAGCADRALLRSLASREDFAFVVEEAGELAATARKIAGTQKCPDPTDQG